MAVLAPQGQKRPLCVGHTRAAIGSVQMIQYSERTLGLATGRQEPEPHLGIVGRHLLQSEVAREI